MTADELLRALKAIEPTIRAMKLVKSLDGLTFELDGGVLLKVPTKGAQRVRKHRKKRYAGNASETESVTETVTPVTPQPPIQAGGASGASRAFSPEDLKKEADSGSDRSPPPGASSAASASIVQYGPEHDRETLIHPDFELHPTAVADCAAYWKVSEAVIRAAVEEFKTFWVIGAGAGKRRSNWQAQCRQDLKRKAESGRLAVLAQELGQAKPAPAKYWAPPTEEQAKEFVPMPDSLKGSPLFKKAQRLAGRQ